MFCEGSVIIHDTQYEGNAFYFFIRNVNYSYNEIYKYRGSALYKVEIIFLQILLHYQHTFPPLRETLHAGHVKIFAEASQTFTHAVLQLAVVHKTVFSECVLQGIKKMEDGAC
jgi:hypothetical protein